MKLNWGSLFHRSRGDGPELRDQMQSRKSLSSLQGRLEEAELIVLQCFQLDDHAMMSLLYLPTKLQLSVCA
jgi:hypothetical protein